MSEQKPYRALDWKETEAAGCDSSYSMLVGPDGFECVLTEPEDRTWWRDGAPVIDKLNELHNSHAALKAEREERMVYISPGYAEQAIANLKEKVDALKAERDACVELLQKIANDWSLIDPVDGHTRGYGVEGELMQLLTRIGGPQ